MKELEGVTYFVPIPTGEMEHLKHPVDADRIIHSVPKVKRQSVSAIVVGVHDGDLIDLVFVHPNRVTTLSSGDWQNALERAYGVRPECHPDLEEGDERLGYYEAAPDMEGLKKFVNGYEKAHDRDVIEKNELRQTILELRAQLADTPEKHADVLAQAHIHAEPPPSAITTNSGGASDADLVTLKAAVDAIDAKVAPPAPPAV